MTSLISPSQLITLAFRTAVERKMEFHKTWTAKSLRLGSLLPDSLLITSIQQAGELDILVRCMEDDPLPTADNASDIDLLSFSYRCMLSTFWVGITYEVCRVLDSRKLLPESDELKSLAYDLKLLRIPLEKHEIANDKKLAAIVQTARTPSFGEDRGRYSYARNDKRKAHIMPSGVSERGSQVWQVVDALSQESYWIERQSLSDRFLAL